MTDRQTAVEVMARAAHDQFRDQFDPEDRPGSWEDLDEEDRASCLENAQCQHDAFLAHLTASGWQIVPKDFPHFLEEDGVVWPDEKSIEAIERADEAYRKTHVSSIGGQTADAGWGRQYGKMLAAVRALLAAAPQFPGREG